MSSSNGRGEDLVLEALRLARGNVSTADETQWDFNNWETCTCGHIYQASGYSDWDTNRIVSPVTVNGLYEETMVAVARANYDEAFVESLGHGMPLACAISDATTAVGASAAGKDSPDYEVLPDYNERQRQAALVLIDNTINMIEAEHERARQEVLKATAKELVTV